MPTYVFKGRNRLNEMVVGERVAENREALLLRKREASAPASPRCASALKLAGSTTGKLLRSERTYTLAVAEAKPSASILRNERWL